MNSSFNYYYLNFLCRVLIQKHVFCPRLSGITFQVSNTQLSAVEDIEVTNSLSALEFVAGQKSFLVKSGLRYVGTSKKAFFLASVNVRKEHFFASLELLSFFLLPNLQRRFGRFSTNWFKTGAITLCCKDLPLFDNYFAVTLKSNFLIKITITARNGFAHLDLLQFFKFNIQQ